MKASLHLRLSQHLAMTPQMQQSFRLLQLSTLELNQEIERALADNPLLERDDDALDTMLRIGADGSIREALPPSPEAAAQGPDETRSDAPAQTADETDNETVGEPAGTTLDDGDWGSSAGRNSNDDDPDRSAEHWATNPMRLADHLRMQLAGTHASECDRALVGMLIEALDDNGYLTSSLEELQTLIPPEAQVEPEDLCAALTLLQSFDPPGVGARTPAECLNIQIRTLANAEDSDVDPAVARLAQRIVSEHLQLLAAHDFNKLRRLLDTTDEALRSACHFIRGLNPHPGVGFGAVGAEYVVPDVIVRRRGNRWMAQLNSDVMPRVRVNTGYAEAVRRQSRQSRSTRPPVTQDAAASPNAVQEPTWSTRLQDARWLIRNLQQRFDTIERVAQAIVDRQQNFFDHGAIAMRPLVLREIADLVQLHESTISRVTTGKYMATPFGLFEFKYFFGSFVATESGGAASSTAIRVLIKQLIGAENPQNPLSDSQIAELLGKQGFMCARRTVAKYRELLNLPPVTQRRVL